MVFVAGPRVIERAKLARLDNTFSQIRTICVGYSTTHYDSYPPAYGFRFRDGYDEMGNPIFNLKPYMAWLDRFHDMDLYDEFAPDSHDTDRDNVLSRLEFSPVGTKSGSDTYTFPTNGPYMIGGVTLPDEVSKQLAEQRPLAYIPVNRKQARKVSEYYYKVAAQSGRERQGNYAECWRPNESLPGGNPLQDPVVTDQDGNYVIPPRWDDFVLISVGPGGSTCGLLTPTTGFLADIAAAVTEGAGYDYYHILALRTYFLATRDLNDNGFPDFDFRARTRKYEQDLADLTLPDGSRLGGPMIYLPKS